MPSGRPLITAFVTAASVLALAGCAPFVNPGPMASEQREVAAVTTVVLDTSGDLTIAEGEPSLVIHAPEAALDRLTSEVRGDTLVLGKTPGPSLSLGSVRYELTVPDLEAIEVNGSGSVDARVSSRDAVRLEVDGSGEVDWSGIDAARLEIRISGSADIELSGSASEADIELDGSGDVDADDLQARDAVVVLDGSGEIDVAVSDRLSASISGSGRIGYSGDPTVTKDVAGSGDIVRN